MDVEDIIGEAAPPQATVTFCVRADLITRWETVHAEFRTASDAAGSLAEPSAKSVLAAKIRDLDEQIKAAQRTFTFQALPAPEYSALLAKYPPKGSDVGVYAFDREAIRTPLVAASSLDPVMTEDQVTRLFSKLSRGQIMLIGNAAYDANMGGLDIPFDGAVYAENQASDGS